MKLDEYIKTIDILVKININNISQGFSDSNTSDRLTKETEWSKQAKVKLLEQYKKKMNVLEQAFNDVVKNIQDQNGK